MNTPALQQQIDVLDAAYQRFSDHHFRASGVVTGREQAWHAFIEAGYGFKELEATLIWIKNGVRQGKRHEPALGFRRLIMDLATFEDEYASAVAERRNSKSPPTPKERALQSFRPTVVDVQPKENTKMASEAAEKALRELRAAVEMK